jgi:hypothetical protein
VFEDKVLRRKSGSERSKVSGKFKPLYNHELQDFHSSPTDVTVEKSRMLRWAGHVTRMDEITNE